MLTQEQAVEIRVLRRQGMGIRAIARELGLSRVTVRRYLRDAGAARYGPREPRPTKVGPYVAYLLSRVEAARPMWIPATVLLREIRERGYDGGISQLKVHLAPLKHGEPEPLVRFETEPGEQMQADFTHVRRGRDALLAFVATLGYSRSSFVRFTSGEDAATLCACLREALIYFGGVPAHVLFDNPTTVVIERDAYGVASTALIGICSRSPRSLAFGHGCAARTAPRPRARSSALTVTSSRASWCRWPRH